MSATIKIRLKNYDKIAQTFKKAPVKMMRELGVAVRKVLIKLDTDAKKEAPVNRQSGGGHLRQSIRHFITGPASGKVEVGADYGIFVHEGTRPHTIRAINKKVLANKRTGQFFGKVVKHPGTRANPFLKRAVDKNAGFINKQFALAVQRVLK